MTTLTVRAACPHDCPDTCAMRVTVDDGRAVRVQGDPDHPTTRGALCTKVSRYTERSYHPERVLHPLKRVGPNEREDLFTVVLEHFLTDTADHADYVLPATTQLEHLDVHSSYGHTYALINEPAIAPVGEARFNTRIFRDLAASMGFDDPCFSDSDEDMARVAFSRDVDFDQLRARGWIKLPLPDAPLAEGNFPTPSGRCMIDVPGLGVPDHVPNYESVHSSPALAARFPQAMISPPARQFLNSTFVNVMSLRDIESEPLLEIHPDDAESRGIVDGQLVRALNDRGEYRCKAALSTRARPGVVNGLGIWWRKLGPAGTNVNEVTHQHLTDLGRAPSFYDCLVDVQAA